MVRAERGTEPRGGDVDVDVSTSQVEALSAGRVPTAAVVVPAYSPPMRCLVAVSNGRVHTEYSRQPMYTQREHHVYYCTLRSGPGILIRDLVVRLVIDASVSSQEPGGEDDQSITK